MELYVALCSKPNNGFTGTGYNNYNGYTNANGFDNNSGYGSGYNNNGYGNDYNGHSSGFSNSYDNGNYNNDNSRTKAFHFSPSIIERLLANASSVLIYGFSASK